MSLIPSYSRKTSVCLWRPRVEVWSCRDFRVMSCPGLRSEPCCNKRFACSDATPSSSTWSSGGSLCTGGLGARTTPERRRCTQRWVRGLRSWVNWLIEQLLLLFSSLIQRLMLHCLLPGWLNTWFVGFMFCWFCFYLEFSVDGEWVPAINALFSAVLAVSLLTISAQFLLFILNKQLLWLLSSYNTSPRFSHCFEWALFNVIL